MRLVRGWESVLVDEAGFLVLEDNGRIETPASSTV